MPDIDTVRGGVGVDPDDELDNLCQHGRPGTADEQDKAKVTNVGQNRSGAAELASTAPSVQPTALVGVV